MTERQRQALGRRKHLATATRVCAEQVGHGQPIDPVRESWAIGGSERWFRTRSGRIGSWNPKTEELTWQR